METTNAELYTRKKQEYDSIHNHKEYERISQKSLKSFLMSSYIVKCKCHKILVVKCSSKFRTIMSIQQATSHDAKRITLRNYTTATKKRGLFFKIYDESFYDLNIT